MTAIGVQRPVATVAQAQTTEGDNAHVTAVVVTRDRPALLNLCLSALVKQTRVLQRIIVIDNASGTETKTVLANWENADVFVLAENSGGAGGFAEGIKQALTHATDWIWLLDDDAIPESDCLACLMSAVPKLPQQAGAVCGSVWEFGRLALRHRRQFKPSGFEHAVHGDNYAKNRVEIGTASFVGLLLKADTAREIGLPDARFFISYDDTEYSLRMRRFGWSLWLIPAAVVVHRRNPDSKLRFGPFGARHFYNIRNQAAVYRLYSRYTFVQRIYLALRGILLVVVAGRCSVHAYQSYRRAMQDSDFIFHNTNPVAS